MDLQGRGALVTGASRGIGRAVAVALARAGARVCVHYRADEDAAQATLARLGGDGHMTHAADIADPAAAEPLVAAAASGLGRIDILVNNAGVYLAHPPVTSSFSDWQAAWLRTLEVNLLGAARLTFLVARHMIETKTDGRIVNVSSRGAFRGEPEAPAYGASKAGLNSFGQSMAVALAPFGITVATVAPGFVETDMAAPSLAGDSGDAIRAQSPFGRVATPDEVAAAVVFLASGDCPFASGAVLDVNGASYLRT